MERRTFLRTGLRAGLGGAAAAAGATALAVPALAQGGLRLTLVTDRAAAGTALSARLDAASGGRMTLEVLERPASERAGFLSAVGGGEADLYLGAEDAFVDVDAGFGLLGAMPGGMGPSELEGWIAVGDGQRLWDALSAEHGVKAFLAGDDGPQPIWSKAPVEGLSDLAAGPVGSTGLGLAALRAMGVEAVDIHAPGTDLSALAALEGLSAADMARADLLGTFPNMTAPSAGRPMSARSAGIALERWEGLDAADRLTLERALQAENGVSRSMALEASARAMRENAGAVRIAEMPQEVWDAQIAAAEAIMLGMLEADAARADMADAYLYFLADVAGWSEVGEAAFFLGRNRALTASL